MVSKIIKTDRLHLRPFQLGDVDDVFEYARDTEWARFLPVPQPYQKTDAEQFVARQVLQDGQDNQVWAIEYEGTVIGGINIGFDVKNQVAEIGYSVARKHWGKGFTTEAAKAVIDEAFSAGTDLRRIFARADARNTGSHRVMEKVGMTREGLLRQHALFRDGATDEVIYGILRSEWEA